MLIKDTDGLIYKIEAENVYEDFYKDKELFNFSNYPIDSTYYNNRNSVKDFVGLKSKRD